MLKEESDSVINTVINTLPPPWHFYSSQFSATDDFDNTRVEAKSINTVYLIPDPLMPRVFRG